MVRNLLERTLLLGKVLRAPFLHEKESQLGQHGMVQVAICCPGGVVHFKSSEPPCAKRALLHGSAAQARIKQARMGGHCLLENMCVNRF